jgi:hypothetical protein
MRTLTLLAAAFAVACSGGARESGTPATPTPVPSGPPAAVAVGPGEAYTSIQAALDAVADGGR